MGLENYKQIILASKLSPVLKEKLVAVLPMLEKNTLNGLEREIARGDTTLIANNLVVLWEKFAELTPKLKTDDNSAKDAFWSLLKEKSELLNDEDKVYFLYFAIDVKNIAISRVKFWSADDLNTIINFEIDLFEYLPIEELMFLLQNYIITVSKKINFYRAIQTVVYDNGWNLEDKLFKDFSDVLLKNKESLVNGNKKSIGEWINNFVSSSSVPLSQRGSFEISDFLIKNKEASSLPAQEKELFSNILKLYIWFLNPEINESDVKEFRQERNREKDETYKKEIDELLNASGFYTRPPQVPTAPNLKVQKPIQEIVKLAPPPEVLAKPVVRPVNIEEVLKKKPLEVELESPGLKMWSGQPSEMPKKPAVDIDKKLEDLKKKVQK